MNDEELFLSQDEVTDYIAEFKKDSYHTMAMNKKSLAFVPTSHFIFTIRI
jgi:hypothetical protein